MQALLPEGESALAALHTAQSDSSDDPVVGWYFPAGQEVHVEAPDAST